MKKEYFRPELNITVFSSENIMDTTSVAGYSNDILDDGIGINTFEDADDHKWD